MLNELAEKIHNDAVAHGFWDDSPRNFGEMLALCHSELSEALEEDRSGMPGAYFFKDDGLLCVDIDDSGVHKMEGTATEMIDCMIRILDYLGHEAVDIDRLVAAKMAYNHNRPPLHGRLY